MNSDGGPAFPLFFPESKTRGGKTLRARDEHPGMSLRDYFAGQALPLCNRSPDVMAKLAELQSIGYPELFACLAYEIADAMLKERAKLSSEREARDL